MKNLKDKPFALVGVNTNEQDPAKVKEIIEAENLNWRSFVSSEAIQAGWNSPGTPTFYILDTQGVIRHKWVSGHPGEQAINSALGGIIQGTEPGARK